MEEKGEDRDPRTLQLGISAPCPEHQTPSLKAQWRLAARAGDQRLAGNGINSPRQ